MYKIEINKKDEYLHIHVLGEESLETMRSYWKEILTACLKTKYEKILVEEILSGEMATMDTYLFSKHFLQETDLPVGIKIAMVFFTGKVIRNGVC